ncbi:CobW family GTP-binding protein [Clostridium folliculivorans]|uniref:GTP-binding protein n=1 Tax=Clostridium folliculivorans TaxID=2886038 RepID=A0A9W5Y6M6_9CLOT|nr:CobW family GTP-binding protein [Clostridium folliculivorans]GKU27357.1 GTP-binding protein [Clostridium folliculivorans]GKU32208.1 GTP-binding protein [Clostridium folliculivorans]
MKIDIISGFLGSGKTTLIKKLISEQLYKERVVIIENEYGEVGIDGALLCENDIKVKELVSGCICCSIANDFVKGIDEILKEYNPDRLIIEPSGVAKLSKVVSLIRTCDTIVNKKINIQAVVVDIKNFDMYITNFGEFYTNQIVNARTVILSRTQNTSDQEFTHVVMAIRKINPRCSIITTPWERLSSQRILTVCEQRLEDLMRDSNQAKKTLNITHVIRDSRTTTNSTAKDVFEVWSKEITDRFTVDEIKIILEKFKDERAVGFIIRAKGIIELTDDKWIQFDYIHDYISINYIKVKDSRRVSVIGIDLNRPMIEELFSSHL